MISSMTGFGRGQAEGDGITATVELKSVNSRFCEISVRGPRNLAEKEVDLQNRIKQSVSRGRVTVHVMIEPVAGATEAEGGGINRPAAEKYRAMLEALVRDLSLQDAVKLDHLLKFPDVFQKEESSEPEIAVTWPVTERALEAAIGKLCEMRTKEGAALRSDLAERLDAIERDLVAVNERAPERISAARVRLQERIAELVGEDRVDKERLEFEIAILSDKLDVNEEAVRLASHLQLFREALDSSEPVGRKLNFIAQEINREINTIGSKANDSELSHVVVRMKEELEKIREQIENVE